MNRRTRLHQRPAETLHVRRRALEAVASGAGAEQIQEMLAALSLSLADGDRFVRHSIIRVITELDNDTFRALGQTVPKLGWDAVISNTVGFLFRRDLKQAKVSKYAIKAAQLVLKGSHPPELKLRAARLMQLGLGGLSLRKGVPPAMTGYTSPFDLAPHERALDSARGVLAEIFPTGDKTLDHELGRLIAVLSSYNHELLSKVLAQITDETSPTDDIHHLLIAGRIPVAPSMKQRQAVAKALVNIELKMSARKMNQDNNWTDRIREMYLQLVEIDPEMPAALITQKGFGHPGHMVFLNGMSKDELPLAVNTMIAAIKANEDYPWTNDVVFALAGAQSAEIRGFLRERYDILPVRGAVTIALGRNPEEQDREKFFAGLKSSQFEVIKSSLAALARLSPKKSAVEIVSLVQTLRRLRSEEQDFRLREQVVQLLRRATEQDFGFVFGKTGFQPQATVMKSWTDWAVAEFPDSAEELLGGNHDDVTRLREVLAKVDWDAGDAQRGAKLFQSRSCGQCHGGGKALGPDLAGAASRFSREDLFTAIAQPSRDVSPRYQTTLIETTSGKVYTGLIIYNSVDGVTLRNGTNQTFRIEANEIEERRTVNTSLMPVGLLNDLQPGDLADLYSYLGTVGGKQ